MPWPDDSWNSTPPLPEAITTGIWPAGAGLLASMATARSPPLRATPSGGDSARSSKPLGGGGGPAGEHGHGPLRRLAGHLLGRELVQQLEAHGAAGAVEAGLDDAVAG